MSLRGGDRAARIISPGTADRWPRDRSDRAARRLIELAEAWFETPRTDRLRDAVVRLVRVHDFRAGEALRLASAQVAGDGRPERLPFVTLDGRLAAAARLEGFRILGLG